MKGHITEPVNQRLAPSRSMGRTRQQYSPINHKARPPHPKRWGNETVDSPIKIDGLKKDKGAENRPLLANRCSELDETGTKMIGVQYSVLRRGGRKRRKRRTKKEKEQKGEEKEEGADE